MKSVVSILAVTLTLATQAFAAPPKPMSLDDSASFLIDAASAEKIWRETTPARVTKLYPIRKYRFVSEVTGGFTDNKTCVVTARAMLLPVVLLPVQGRKVVYAPIKSATAFDAVPSLSREQCQGMARVKLKEAIQSLSASLAAS
ncbi:MAG: hypothetical protein V4844_06920 [Pseudomonadota bacterium]|jgi:hypothetical protein